MENIPQRPKQRKSIPGPIGQLLSTETKTNFTLSQIEKSDGSPNIWKLMDEFLPELGIDNSNLENLCDVNKRKMKEATFKVPWIVLQIQSMDTVGKDQSATAAMVDRKSKTASGDIHADVISNFGKDIASGTLFLLKNISAFASSGTSHFIITPDNIALLLPPGINNKYEVRINSKKNIQKIKSGYESDVMMKILNYKVKQGKSLDKSKQQPLINFGIKRETLSENISIFQKPLKKWQPPKRSEAKIEPIETKIVLNPPMPSNPELEKKSFTDAEFDDLIDILEEIGQSSTQI